MNYQYYYNHVPGEVPWRNNLIYTSLINDDRSVFVQWYNNDTEYHRGMNQVVDPELMDEKWQREVKYLTLMQGAYPQHVPKILDIDYSTKKIYLEIQGVDIWQRSMDNNTDFAGVLPNWREQILEITKAHRQLGLYKYSLHPSSYFIVDGKIKTFNYFFTYHEDEGPISIQSHQSHISDHRQEQMRGIVEGMGISWTEPQPHSVLQQLCFESFSTNYPRDFIEASKEIYRD